MTDTNKCAIILLFLVKGTGVYIFMINNRASSVIAFVITLIVVLIGIIKTELTVYNFKEQSSSIEVLALENKYNVEEEISDFINNNIDTFNFYAETFEIDINSLKEQIVYDNMNNIFNSYDIGNTGIIYNSLDKNLIDYLFHLEKVNIKLFKNTHYNGSIYTKDEIYNTLNKFCNIFGNVDYSLLAGIVYIETGNLNAQSMLNFNNIYGGLNNGNLIKYKNMNYGILTYVKLMSEKYYNQGLTTVESIAKKFNPGHGEWIIKVKKAMLFFEKDI